MTGVIKAAAAAAATRTFVGAIAASPPRAAELRDVRSPVELALDEAREEIDKLQATLLSAEQNACAREAAARRAGRQEGLKEAVNTSTRQLELLGEGLTAAQASWSEALAALDLLAVALARDALGKIFGSSEDLAALTTAAIARRMATLRAESTIGLAVSAVDFPDPSALDALRTAIGGTPLRIDSDPLLAAGEARIALQLGRIDVGPVPQWRALDTFLRQLTAGPL